MQRRADSETWFTFLGVRADGAVPVVDLMWADTDDHAIAEARSFLRQHPSCALVEVWRDGLLQAKIED